MKIANDGRLEWSDTERLDWLERMGATLAPTGKGDWKCVVPGDDLPYFWDDSRGAIDSAAEWEEHRRQQQKEQGSP